MSEFIQIPKIELKIKDVYALKEFVKLCEDWFKDNNYIALQDEKEVDYSNYESLYTHKITGGGSVMDIWLWWRLIKYPPETTNPKTSYIRYRLNIDAHFLGDSGDTEVMHRGKKIKLNKGELKLEISPFVEVEYKSEWPKQGSLKLMDYVFRRKIYKKELDEQFVYMYEQSYKFQMLLKQFFKLEGFMPKEITGVGQKGLN